MTSEQNVELEGPTCLFPTRNHGQSQPGHRKVLEIGLSSAKRLTDHCTVHGLDMTTTLVATWAMIVQPFVDGNVVLVGIDRIRSTNTRDCCSRSLGIKQDMEVLMSAVEGHLEVQELFQADRWVPTSAPSAAFNTGVALSHEIWHGLPSSRRDEDACDILLAYSVGSDMQPPALHLFYNTNLISDAFADSLVDMISHVVETTTQNNSLRYDEVSLLSAAHRQQLDRWNSGGSIEKSGPQSLYQTIYEQSLVDPTKIAIYSWDGEMTYSKLIEACSRWVPILTNLGVKEGIFVPICFEKSLWAVAAMLAINKAGAAFIPLDPAHPASRRESILQSLNSPVALTSELHQKIVENHVQHTLAVSASSTARLTSDIPATPGESKASSPAYCFFTSGSTGKPKGCVVSHRALASIASHSQELHLERTSRSLQFASFCFGISLIEIWCTLAAGATVCMPSDSDRVNKLSTVMNRTGVDWAILTPTMLDSICPELTPGLKSIVVAGEPLKKSQISLWMKSTRLFQGYGLTEWAGIFSVSPQIQSLDGLGNIGAPKHATYWVLDPRNPERLAGAGAVGELVIEGPSMADGYLHDLDGRSGSFFSDPPWLERETGRRFYRTGDLVFCDTSGYMRYVGRKDRQVKLRGQRVEIGEVEHHIAEGDQALPGAVVDGITPSDQDATLTLAAFIPWASPNGIHRSGPRSAGDSLVFAAADESFLSAVQVAKNKLQALLPNYMIPTYFLPVRQMPTTITGKIARRTLRDEASKLQRADLAVIAGLHAPAERPATPWEAKVHTLIAEVLNLRAEEVGMEHSFVSLGGDSVLAIKLVGRARKQGLHLTVKDVFRTSDLRELAHLAGSKADSKPATNGTMCHEILPFSLIETGSKEDMVRAAAEMCKVPRSSVEDIYPCTPLQEGMMALGATRPGAYVARFIYRVGPAVDLSRLRSAWEMTVAKSPILRTRIIRMDDQPQMHQIVIREDFWWDDAEEWDSYLLRRQHTPMLLGDPLVYGAFLRDNQSNISLVLTAHHAVCDRWSAQVWLTQVESAYNGAILSESSFVPYLQYLNHTLEDARAVAEYWKSQFAGLEAKSFPSLPSTDYVPQATEQLSAQVAVPRSPPRGYTMASVVRLAWGLSIAHYSSTNDVVYGATVTGRNAPVPDIESLNAPTVGTVPVRMVIKPGSTVEEALAAVQTQSTDMIPFEPTGLQDIRKCSPEAEEACTFQNQLVIQAPTDGRNANLLQLVEDGAAVEGGFSSYAVVMLCKLTTVGDIDVDCEFDPNVIDPKTMGFILDHFKHALLYTLEHPETPIGQVPISVKHADRLREWNSTVPPGADECVHKIIQRQCMDQADSDAVCSWDGTLTFAELDSLSTRLSVWLALHGVGPESLVPLCFEKSRWTVVALLAVLKAGGAFVLLDVSQPLQRLHDICQQLNSNLVLASEAQASLAAQLRPDVREVSERTFSQLPVRLAELGGFASRPNTPAYVVFTSGSTGTPKGIVVEHRSYSSAAKYHTPAYRITKGSRMFQFASYAFDTSIIETLTPLMAGACVCIPSEDERQNSLTSVARKLAITHSFMTPSLARSIAQSGAERFAEVMPLVGEAMTSSDIAQWANRCHLMNGYGPAECSVSVSTQPRLTEGSDPRGIGFPTGVVCWIVDPDDHNALRPIGATGELLVEGHAVTRGYLNQPSLSSAVFLEEPPTWLAQVRPQGPVSRFYKTGDLARYRTDGSLVYVGRKDVQVKVRGQRIELSEVESSVRLNIPEILDVVVEKIIFKESPDRPRLVAFAWSRMANQSDEDEDIWAKPTNDFLKQVAVGIDALSGTLPRYMIPDIFIPVRSIPMTMSGKANRRLLRDQASTLSEKELSIYTSGATSKHVPRNEGERIMRGIWAQVLKRNPEEVGVNESFFHLGGDSISAMQVVSQARAKGLTTSVSQIMQHKTIGRIVQNFPQDPHPSRSNIDAVEPNRFLPLSPTQRSFFNQQRKPRLPFNQTFLVRIANPVTIATLEKALEKAVRRYPMLQTRFVQNAHGHWQRMISTEVNQSYVLKQHIVSQPQGWDHILADSHRRVDIEHGPLLSVDLLDIADDSCQYLSIVLHYLLKDAVSSTFLTDMETALQSPEHTVGYCQSASDHAVWSIMEQENKEAQLVDLSCDCPDPMPFWGITDANNVMDKVVTKGFALDSQLSQSLLGPRNVVYNTHPEDLFHAALLYSFVRVFPNCSPPLVNTFNRRPVSATAAVDHSNLVVELPGPTAVGIEIDGSDGISHVVRVVKDSRRAALNRGCVPCVASHPLEISLNYADYSELSNKPGALFVADQYVTLGVVRADPEIQRPSLFDISVTVWDGCLQFSFTYASEMYNQGAIEQWAQVFKDSLTTLNSEVTGPENLFTLSDIPLLPLTYDQLDALTDSTLMDLGIFAEDVEDIYPCSPNQRGMLLAQAKDEGIYTTTVVWKVASTDLQRIQKAWQSVVNRHAILRTALIESPLTASYLDQVVLKHAAPSVTICTSDAKSTPISRSWPKGGLLHRMALFKTEDGCICRLTLNHAIMDATTVAIIAQDLECAYRDELPEGSAPMYRDYVSYLSEQSSENARNHWATYLEGVEPCHFPSINGENCQRSDREEVLKKALSHGATLEDFCRSRDVTLWNMVCLAWTLVLRSFVHSDNICFGYLTSGRDLPIDGIEEIAGPFINILPFYMSVDESLTVDEAIRKIQASYLASLAHQTFPLSDVHRLAQVGSQSLFNTMVDVQRRQRSGLNTSELPIFRQSHKEEVTEYDLVLSLDTDSVETNVQLRYKTTVVSTPQAASILAAFETALERMTAYSEETLKRIDLCSDQDKALIWKQNEIVPEGIKRCVHDMISECSKLRPDAPAVSAWDGDFTYKQLESLASQLAAHLKLKGVGPEVIVPLCFEKSRWVPVAILGVIKAGGAFLLLDSSHPAERLKALCEEVKCPVLISGESHAGLSSQLSSDVVLLGDNNQIYWPESFIPATESVQPNNTLYVIFTSGSTGKPKAVMIDHEAYCTSAVSHMKILGLDHSARVAQFSAYAFDVSIMDHLTTLIAGACICIPSDAQRRDNLAESVSGFQASHAILVPSISRLFPADVPTTLTTLGLIGEPMTQKDLTHWADRVRLMNTYGPAECSVISTIQASNQVDSDPRNIGTPCGCVCWVVDAHDPNRLVPCGAVGELVIEGPIVGRGYLNNPVKTKEAFIPRPQWLQDRQPGDRGCALYRTGDLVRMNPDGTFTYIGRRDTQVKLRGQRIELGEVEHHVRQCFDSVGEVVAEVILLPGSNSPQLVACIWTSSNEKDNNSDFIEAPTDEFRARVVLTESRLQQAVPPFLHPSVFVPLTRIPRTASGKIDRNTLRKALLASPGVLHWHGNRSAESKQAPSTDTEKHYQRIWADILNIPQDSVGANDNLFHLGGDSIDAMKVAAVSRASGIAVGVADIFAHPILSELAAMTADTSLTLGTTMETFSLSPVEDPKSLALTLQQQGVVPMHSRVADILPVTEVQTTFIDCRTFHYFNFRLRGTVDMGQLRQTCESVLERYSILRTMFLQHAGHRLQVVLDNAQLPFLHHVVDGDLASSAQTLWEDDRSRFDIWRDLPVHFILVSNSAQDQHVISLRISHAQWDGVSLPLLFRDMAAIYNGEQTLPPTSPYSTYLYHRASRRNSAVFQFWRDYLLGSTMANPFPAAQTLNRQRPAQTQLHIQSIASPELPPGITMATLVKAACGFCLANLTSNRDVTFGQSVNGRSMPIENVDVILGPFINFIPARITLDSNWTILDLCNHVKTQYARTLPYDHVELQDIVRNSTEWAPDTKYGLIVQHQNIELEHKLPLQGLEVTYDMFARFEPGDEVWVFSEPHPDRLDVQVCCDRRVLDDAAGQELARSLAETVQLFSRAPHTLLSSLFDF